MAAPVAAPVVAVAAAPAAPGTALSADGIVAALARGALEVFYQPIVMLPGRQVIGFEALARIRALDGTLVPPADFISAAESSGLIGQLGHEVLRQAVTAAARWRKGDLATATVSVNISITQLARPGIVEEVGAVLGQHEVPGSALILEITESTAASTTVRPVIERLTSLGIRVAIDDFGTGFATLDTLRHIPAHMLKLDRSFVGGVTHQDTDRAIVRVVADLAHSLGMSLVAEGVETEEQAEALLQLGCGAMQGYLFAVPGPDPQAAAELVFSGGTPSPSGQPMMEGREGWSVRLDESLLSAARLLGESDDPHRGAVNALAVALARAAHLDPRSVRAVGQIALVHDLSRLLVDGLLPVALRADRRLERLAVPPSPESAQPPGSAQSPGAAQSSESTQSGAGDVPVEVDLVRLAVSAVDRARLVDVELGREALCEGLRAEAAHQRAERPELADWLLEVAGSPPEVVPFGKLMEDLDRRRMGRRGMEERMRSVFGITKVLGSNRETGELMRLALEEVRQIVGAASASVERWERDTNTLRCLVSVGHLAHGEKTFPQDEVYKLADYVQARRTMLTGLPYLHRVDDPAADHDAVQLLERLGKYSSAAVPVYVDGRIWGQLWFSTDHGEPPFEAVDVETLMAVATLMGGVVVQAESLQAVDRMAFEDVLTGVGNRRMVDDTLDRLSARGEAAAVVLLDIDGLKQINDTRGHAAGDVAIQLVADVVSAAVVAWPGATIGRLGGDEFCVVLPGCSATEARRLLKEAQLVLAEKEGPAVSVGVARGGARWQPRDVLAAADEELYRSKRGAHSARARKDRRRPIEARHPRRGAVDRGAGDR